MSILPRKPNKVIVPPLKIQGIKTKLVEFIMTNITWDGEGRWIEPFFGSGVVLFNVQPQRALVSDINPHIIRFYRSIYTGEITASKVRAYLEIEGDKLSQRGEKYYYEVRRRFNESEDPLDFLFLNRASFNGIIRFNKKGEFNVPFCRKPDRYRVAYITKIVNQVKAVQEVMRDKEWEFRVASWQDSVRLAKAGDFVYMDPPYVGRYADYYTRWTDKEAIELAQCASSIPCGFALSMWKENRYRHNDHIYMWSGHTVERAYAHFYHVGATENLRNSMIEVLLIKKGYEAPLEAGGTESITEKTPLPPLFLS